MLRGALVCPPKGRWWTPGGPRRHRKLPPLAGPAMNRLDVGFDAPKTSEPVVSSGAARLSYDD
jgi:hypothetical protein